MASSQEGTFPLIGRQTVLFCLLGVQAILMVRHPGHKTPHSHIDNVAERAAVHSTENVTEGTMPADERMSVDERREYLRKAVPRHVGAEVLRRSRGAAAPHEGSPRRRRVPIPAAALIRQ